MVDKMVLYDAFLQFGVRLLTRLCRSMLDALPEAERRAAVIEKGPDGHTLLMAACQYHAEVCFAKRAGACGADVDDCTVTVLALCSRLLPRFLNGGLIHMKSMNGVHLVAIWR